MGNSSTNRVTAAELDAALALPSPVHFDLGAVTAGLSMDDLCELAAETTGNTAYIVRGLIEGVVRRHGHVLDDSALAALNAVAYYHVPTLQDTYNALERSQSAD